MPIAWSTSWRSASRRRGGLPDRLNDFKLTRNGTHIDFSWSHDPKADGGYNFYQTDEKTECARMRQSHPDYDPKDPAALHTWSQDETERLFATALKSGGRWVVDGTGTNAEKMVRRIAEARAAGFSIHLMFVTCTLATSLRRNASRPRVVPEDVIRSKALDINTSFQLVAPHADTLEVVDNDAAW